MAVEEAKARNREILAKQRGEEKKAAEADMTKDAFAADLAKLKAEDKRIRDVRVGPDGYVYLLTDEDAAELWRLVPR